jgi:hypothetical protein
MYAYLPARDVPRARSFYEQKIGLLPKEENAGGVVSVWEGGRCDAGGDVLACGDRALHAELLRRIARR